MKNQTFTLLVIFFLSQLNLSAQWESFENNIIPTGFRMWSIKVAPDASVRATTTLDAFPPAGEVPRVHRSVDEGQTWTISEIPEGLSTYGWDLSPVDLNTAYVALDTAGLFKTSDGGASWNKVESYPYQAVLVHLFNEDEGWVMGVDSIGFIVILCLMS